MDKVLLKVDEAVLALGLGRSVVYQKLLTGEIGSVKIGRSRRIPASEIDRFVERLQAEQAENTGAVQ